jgi:POT family proton-dependent oligopeptide transporter
VDKGSAYRLPSTRTASSAARVKRRDQPSRSARASSGASNPCRTGLAQALATKPEHHIGRRTLAQLVLELRLVARLLQLHAAHGQAVRPVALHHPHPLGPLFTAGEHPAQFERLALRLYGRPGRCRRAKRQRQTEQMASLHARHHAPGGVSEGAAGLARAWRNPAPPDRQVARTITPLFPAPRLRRVHHSPESPPLSTLSPTAGARPTAVAPRDTILGQPNALFVLFFTEMWERFSYYGMRALLVLFLVSEVGKGGWGWTRADATSLYGWYTGLVYLTPILGGYLADRVLGTRRSVLWGGFVIAAGHAALFMETVPTFYLGLALIILGTGLFKPNISAIVGQLYGKDNEGQRDGGYTLFYMGVNAGAFFGISLCGYIGEKVSWNLGFGLAGAFMVLGALQFWFSRSLFGAIGEKLDADKAAALAKAEATDDTPEHVVGDRLKAIVVFSFFTIFFWFAFEQAGGSMTIFAADYTDRQLAGTSGLVFKLINTAMTVVPLAILSWLLLRLYRNTGGKVWLANLSLAVAFAGLWGLCFWMLGREFMMEQSEVPATWFGVLNSFFIVVLAPAFSKMWEDKWNPSGPVKFGVGLILLGLGFAALALRRLGHRTGRQDRAGQHDVADPGLPAAHHGRAVRVAGRPLVHLQAGAGAPAGPDVRRLVPQLGDRQLGGGQDRFVHRPHLQHLLDVDLLHDLLRRALRRRSGADRPAAADEEVDARGALTPLAPGACRPALPLALRRTSAVAGGSGGKQSAHANPS